MGVRLLIAMVLLTVSQAQAQFRADIRVGSVNSTTLTSRMERGLTGIVMEINSAYRAGRPLANPDRTYISDEVIRKLNFFWSTSAFRVTQTELVLTGLTLRQRGYQVRDIPIYIDKEAEGDQEREIGFEFDQSGQLTDFFVCLGLNSYRSPGGPWTEATETSRRFVVEDFLQRFRTAYNVKDISMLEKCFSNDALIIVGKVLKVYKTSHGNEMPGIGPGVAGERIEYIKQSKAEYIDNIRKAFRHNEYLKVDFDDIEISQSVKNPEIYGITMRQAWKSGRYSDQGWLFLLIDFRKGDPIIHIRTWHPLYLNGVQTSRDDVFTIGESDWE